MARTQCEGFRNFFNRSQCKVNVTCVCLNCYRQRPHKLDRNAYRCLKRMLVGQVYQGAFRLGRNVRELRRAVLELQRIEATTGHFPLNRGLRNFRALSLQLQKQSLWHCDGMAADQSNVRSRRTCARRGRRPNGAVMFTAGRDACAVVSALARGTQQVAKIAGEMRRRHGDGPRVRVGETQQAGRPNAGLPAQPIRSGESVPTGKPSAIPSQLFR
jgi:hypothetical protein